MKATSYETRSLVQNPILHHSLTIRPIPYDPPLVPGAFNQYRGDPRTPSRLICSLSSRTVSFGRVLTPSPIHPLERDSQRLIAGTGSTGSRASRWKDNGSTDQYRHEPRHESKSSAFSSAYEIRPGRIDQSCISIREGRACLVPPRPGKGGSVYSLCLSFCPLEVSANENERHSIEPLHALLPWRLAQRDHPSSQPRPRSPPPAWHILFYYRPAAVLQQQCLLVVWPTHIDSIHCLLPLAFSRRGKPQPCVDRTS